MKGGPRELSMKKMEKDIVAEFIRKVRVIKATRESFLSTDTIDRLENVGLYSLRKSRTICQ